MRRLLMVTLTLSFAVSCASEASQQPSLKYDGEPFDTCLEYKSVDDCEEAEACTWLILEQVSLQNFSVGKSVCTNNPSTYSSYVADAYECAGINEAPRTAEATCSYRLGCMWTEEEVCVLDENAPKPDFCDQFDCPKTPPET